MDNIKDMTNDEFISHLMTGYNKHGALVQMVILDCLQRGLEGVYELHCFAFSAVSANEISVSITASFASSLR